MPETEVVAADTADSLEPTQPGQVAPEVAQAPPDTATQAPVPVEKAPEAPSQERPAPNEWEPRLRGMQARATRAEQELATLREEKAALEARVGSFEQYAQKNLMTEEDWQAYQEQIRKEGEDRVQQTYQSKMLKQANMTAWEQLGDEMAETAQGLIELGVIKDTDAVDAKAAIKVRDLPGLMEVIDKFDLSLPKMPTIDKWTSLQSPDLNQLTETFRRASIKALSGLHVKKVEGSLRAEIDALKEQLTTRDALLARQEAESRAVSSATTGASGNDPEALLWKRYVKWEPMSRHEKERALAYGRSIGAMPS